MTQSTGFRRLALIATVLAFGVVMLGAYVRLNDAGLGCPDWPGCYGHVVVPEHPDAMAAADAAYPQNPVQPAKGWKEMTHRYVAGTLGLLVLALAVWSVLARRRTGHLARLPLVLLGVIIFQALLGMWTVTWKLKPIVVMAHLLGGMTTLALLWWLTMSRLPGFSRLRLPRVRGLRVALALGLALVIGQIALGGWTSANYAALACNEFPTCTRGQWWPPTDFSEAFVLWRGIGPNYEYGVLDQPARIAIHLTHRMGALVVTTFLLGLAIALWRAVPGRVASGSALAVFLALAAQVSLGIANVVFSLPLPVAVAHNAGAAILLLTLVTVNYLARNEPADEHV